MKSRVIRNPDQLERTVEWLRSMYRSFADAGQAMRVTLAEHKPTRTEDQNRRFHAMVTDISLQCTWQGRKLSMDQWKVLLVSGHAVATGGRADVVQGLEGEAVSLRESTARMSVGRMASLIDYVQAWGDHLGVEWSEPAREDVA